MNQSKKPALTHQERLRQLAEMRRKILSIPSEKAMAAVLEHPQPAALVHSFPEEDLHFLIYHVGLEDALPLIRLASNRQWEFFLDLETWHRDQLDFQQATKWLQLLVEADPNRLANWCFGEKLEFLEFYLHRNIELRIRDSDETPTDFGNGYFSDDDTFYVRLLEYPAATPEEKTFVEHRNIMLGKLLKRLSILDHPRYQGLLLEAVNLIPSEIEEELFRLRNVRLAEKGFLPFDEAIGVYQPMEPDDIGSRGKKIIHPSSTDGSLLPAPLFTSGFLEGDNLFVRALKTVAEPHVVQLLQTEFASLCNQLISADQTIIRDREQLHSVVGKAGHYLSIGLERLTLQETRSREKSASDQLHLHLLTDIFRIGFGEAMKLKWKAEGWHPKSWVKEKGIGLPFWDEAFLGVLGGLLLQTPKYYLPSGSPSKYRDFQTLEEIESTGRKLQQILAVDRVLKAIDPIFESISPNRLMTYKNLLLTLWAGSIVEPSQADARPTATELPLDAFKNFFEQLWTEEQGKRIIGNEKKAAFLSWVAERSGMATEVLSEELGIVFEALFSDIEAELAAVKIGNLDPRYVHLFLLRR